MKVNEVTAAITDVCSDNDLTFPQKSEVVAGWLYEITDDVLLEHLDDGGVIPECFGHDSTEEKLFAKYCDTLLAAALNALHLEAEVIAERADAADVVAKGEGYSIVGDAKAFRLSRTAKNQKDFKVEALNGWRKGAEYACLMAPLYQYPNSNSQIYHQASRFNVTLLSYTHLAYLIRHGATNDERLRSLWEVPGSCAVSKDADSYWKAIQEKVCEITGTRKKEWDEAVQKAADRLPKQGAEQIAFWESEKKRIKQLSHEATTAALIEALKIDGKIAVIRKNFKEAQEATETFET